MLEAPAGTTPAGIPRVIHRIWLDQPITAEVAALGRAWQELHPRWLVRTWRDWELPALRHQRYFDAATNPAQKADIARLELLHRYGGVYVDTDFEPRRALDGLIADAACFAAAEDGRWLGTAIMGCVPGHPFLAHLVDGIATSVADHPGAPPNRQTGPIYVSKQFVAYTRMGPHPPVVVFPAALFYPYHFSEPERRAEDFPDAYAVHHWSHSWKTATDGSEGVR